MAIYIGSDNKSHKTNIIGLLPSKDYGRECAFASCINAVNFEQLFPAWNNWTNKDIKKTIYVQYSTDNTGTPKALGMTVEFENEKDHNVALTHTELNYLTSCLILFLHNNKQNATTNDYNEY